MIFTLTVKVTVMKIAGETMTYGEAHVAEHRSLDMEDGRLIYTLRIENKPKPMSPKDAGFYYNTKLYNHWLAELNELKPKTKKNQCNTHPKPNVWMSSKRKTTKGKIRCSIK